MSFGLDDYKLRWFGSGGPTSFPGVVAELLLYTVSISAALALLNIVPAFGLDGEAALGAVLDMLVPHSDYLEASKLTGCFVGTLLLVFNVVAITAELLITPPM